MPSPLRTTGLTPRLWAAWFALTAPLLRVTLRIERVVVGHVLFLCQRLFGADELPTLPRTPASHHSTRNNHDRRVSHSTLPRFARGGESGGEIAKISAATKDGEQGLLHWHVKSWCLNARTTAR